MTKQEDDYLKTLASDKSDDYLLAAMRKSNILGNPTKEMQQKAKEIYDAEYQRLKNANGNK